MCQECFNQLEISYRFKQQWTKSHDQLTAILTSSCAHRTKETTKRKTGPSKGKAKATEQCFDCGKVFVHSGYLKTHMRTHRGERPHVCDVCDMKFGQACNLASHMRIHTGVKPYQCEICSKLFSSSSNLKAHKRTHSEQRDFACQECSLRFKSAAELASHRDTHSGIRKYRCELCDKAFYKVAYLNVHIRTVHQKEKRHRCSDCGKQFSNTSNLISHQRIHTGAKPFACDACGARFNQSSALARHSKHNCRMAAEPEMPSATPTPDIPLDIDNSDRFLSASPVGSMGSNMALNVDDDDDDNNCLAASILATTLANNACEGHLGHHDHEPNAFVSYMNPDAMHHFSDSEYCRFNPSSSFNM